MAKRQEESPEEVEAAGPGELGRTPSDAVEAARIDAPTRGNRRLEAVLEALNTDPEVRAWWHMTQVQSERLGMSDHSWVHMRIVLNIALRLLRLLVKGGLEPAMVSDHAMKDRDAEVVVAAGSLLHDVGMSPPRRPRGLQPLPRGAQAPGGPRADLPRPRRTRGGDRRVSARDHRPPSPG
jgi:hypothetical protein